MATSIRGLYDTIYTEGYENDEADRPLGNVYHMTCELWKERYGYNRIAYIHGVLLHHGIKIYGKQFLSYKNGVMKPKKFDSEETEKDIKSI